MALEAIPRSQTNKLQLEIRPFQKGNFIFRPESLRDYVGFRKGTRGSNILVMYFSIAPEFQMFFWFSGLEE